MVKNKRVLVPVEVVAVAVAALGLGRVLAAVAAGENASIEDGATTTSTRQRHRTACTDGREDMIMWVGWLVGWSINAFACYSWRSDRRRG